MSDSISLKDLEAEFLKRTDDDHWRRIESIEGADGIIFLCPICWDRNKGPVGTHSVICWRPHVPQTTSPKPGRWEFEGTGIVDLTLVAGSSSIHLQGGCGWHGFVRNGRATLTC